MSRIDLRLGDCLDVMAGMPENSVDAVITDPPYGIAYQSARRTKTERFNIIEGDTHLKFNWLELAYDITRDAGCLFCFCRWDVQQMFFEAIAHHWAVKSQVIWDRGIHGLGDLKAQYAPMHDIAWFATKGKFQFPGKRPKSVLHIDRLPASQLQHPTQKPLALMKVIVQDLTRPGDTVLDMFAGSGTTGVACMQTDRQFIGIEIDPTYFAIAEKRINAARQQLVMELPHV